MMKAIIYLGPQTRECVRHSIHAISNTGKITGKKSHRDGPTGPTSTWPYGSIKLVAFIE